MRVVLDLEANGFLPDASRVWCCGCVDIDTGASWYVLELPGIRDLVHNSDLVIGHNWLGYDLPLLEKITGDVFDQDPTRVVDTYELSVTLNPNRLHSVEDWARRLGVGEKVHVGDDEWNDPTKIELYCRRAVQDAKIEHMIFKALLREMGVNDWSDIWNVVPQVV